MGLVFGLGAARSEPGAFPVLVNPVEQLIPDDGGPTTQIGLGASVSVYGDSVAVGTPGADAVLVFQRNPSEAPPHWRHEVVLRPTSPQTGSSFGWSVSLGDGFLVVGAPDYEHSLALQDAGSAFVFKRDGVGSWSQVAELRSEAPENHTDFGYAVSYSGQRVAVGAPGEDGGVACIFERNSDDTADSWPLIKKIPNPAGDDGLGFGKTLLTAGAAERWMSPATTPDPQRIPLGRSALDAAVGQRGFELCDGRIAHRGIR